MDIQFLSDSVKITATIIGGILGISSVAVDYKKADGSINKWGKLVIFGIAVSATFGSLATVLDGSISRLDSNDQAKKNQVMLDDIDRSLHPIRQATLFYEFQTAVANKDIDNYVSSTLNVLQPLVGKARLSDSAAMLKETVELDKMHVQTPEIRADGSVMQFDILPESTLRPKSGNGFIEDAISSFAVNLAFFKKPIDPKKFRDVVGLYAGGPDLIMPSIGDFGDPLGLNINLPSKTVGIDDNEKLQSEFWKSNEKITSTLDLAGSQVIISFGESYPNGCVSKAEDFKKSMVPTAIDLDFGEGVQIWLPIHELVRTELPNSCVVYSYTFPESYDGVQGLIGDDDNY